MMPAPWSQAAHWLSDGNAAQAWLLKMIWGNNAEERVIGAEVFRGGRRGVYCICAVSEAAVCFSAASSYSARHDTDG